VRAKAASGGVAVCVSFDVRHGCASAGERAVRRSVGQSTSMEM